MNYFDADFTALNLAQPANSTKSVEKYYTSLNYYSLVTYILLMSIIFLSFGYIREKRNDKIKTRSECPVEEMLASFGLKGFTKEQLHKITQKFNLRLNEQPKGTYHNNETIEKTEKNSYFGWLSELIKIDESEIRRCCGLEAYLYLMFVRFSAYYFAFVSVFSGSILLPTYLLGETNDAELQNSLESITLLNALGKPKKMWIVFAVTVVIGISGHLFVYLYQSTIKIKRLKYEEQRNDTISEKTIREHTLLITGVNNELSADDTVKKIRDFFPKFLQACKVDDENIEPPLVV